MSDAIDVFHVKGADSVIRSLDEHYDCQKAVEQDPHGAWLAIQNQAYRIEVLEANVARLRDALEKALYRLDASAFTNAEHAQAAGILRAALQDTATDTAPKT